MSEVSSTNLLLFAVVGGLIAVAFAFIYFASTKKENKRR